MNNKIRDLLMKYENRYTECEQKFNLDIAELNTATTERISWLNEDIISLNGQLGAYECIIKDLRGLLE